MHTRVVVTGMGALSALGETVDALWDRLLLGRSGIRTQRRFVNAGLPVTTGGDVDAVPQDVNARDELLATLAIDQAIDMAALDSRESGFIWSTGLDAFRYDDRGLLQRPTGECFAALAQRFGNPRRMIATACASGTQAVGAAFHLVRSGAITRCVAGGSSAMLTPFYLIGFAGIQALAVDVHGEDPATVCRPFDRTRRGFALADGAGALVLESYESALQRGATICAEMIGFGMSQDAFDLNRPLPDGSASAMCMRRALADADLEAEAVDAVNAHGTGTILGDIAETNAIHRAFPNNWKRLPTSSAKGAIGHAQSAAGALEAIVAIKTSMTGVVPPTVNLSEPDDECLLDHVLERPRDTGAGTVMSTSFGMGGQNAAVIFTRATRDVRGR